MLRCAESQTTKALCYRFALASLLAQLPAQFLAFLGAELALRAIRGFSTGWLLFALRFQCGPDRCAPLLRVFRHGLLCMGFIHSLRAHALSLRTTRTRPAHKQ